MIFKHISDISIYITSNQGLPYTDLFVAVDFVEKTWARCDDIFLLNWYKVVFMNAAVTGETTVSAAPKAPPAGRESICIFNKPISSNMFLLLLTLFFSFL